MSSRHRNLEPLGKWHATIYICKNKNHGRLSCATQNVPPYGKNLAQQTGGGMPPGDTLIFVHVISDIYVETTLIDNRHHELKK